MRPDWAREIRDTCVRKGVGFFVKQWGGHDENGKPVRKGKAGRVLDAREWNELPAGRVVEV